MSYEDPAPGEVVANLATLKQYVGSRTTQDDELLTDRLAVATEHVYHRIYLEDRPHNDVQEAILLLASRLYKRRQSPEGVAGFGGDGGLVRILFSDPDVRELLQRHLNLSDAGLA